jgi:hypothetical protein
MPVREAVPAARGLPAAVPLVTTALRARGLGAQRAGLRGRGAGAAVGAVAKGAGAGDAGPLLAEARGRDTDGPHDPGRPQPWRAARGLTPFCLWSLDPYLPPLRLARAAAQRRGQPHARPADGAERLRPQPARQPRPLPALPAAARRRLRRPAGPHGRRAAAAAACRPGGRRPLGRPLAARLRRGRQAWPRAGAPSRWAAWLGCWQR